MTTPITPPPILVRWGTSWHPGTKLDICPGKPGWVWAASEAFRGRKLLVETEWCPWPATDLDCRPIQDGYIRTSQTPTGAAAMTDPTDAQMVEWNAWLAERPESVRAIAERLPPWKDYWLKNTGQRAQPRSYNENGTVSAVVWYDELPIPHGVFGLSPDDFVTVKPTREEVTATRIAEGLPT